MWGAIEHCSNENVPLCHMQNNLVLYIWILTFGYSLISHFHFRRLRQKVWSISRTFCREPARQLPAPWGGAGSERADCHRRAVRHQEVPHSGRGPVRRQVHGGHSAGQGTTAEVHHKGSVLREIQIMCHANKERIEGNWWESPMLHVSFINITIT